MIDPNSVTNTNRTDAELQEFLMFGMCVAGKRADIQSRKLDEFLYLDVEPFLFVRLLGSDLEQRLRLVRMGKYNTLVKGFQELAKWDPPLRKVSAGLLMDRVTGIGLKTAKFFIMHSRQDPNHACLDTHILSWLQDLGYDVPGQTPSNPKTYTRAEKIFLKEAKLRDRHPADLDLAIWRSRSYS